MRITMTDYKKRVFSAMNFISRNIERDLSLEEIADTAAFSMFHFHRIFKAVAGETVAAFTRRLRLELAANRLLSHRRTDITTIALECGFSSSQNFARAFREHFGSAPSEFRASGIGTAVNVDSGFTETVLYPETAFMGSPKKEKKLPVNAEIRELPGCVAVYVRRVGPYVREICESAFMELMRWPLARVFLGPGNLFAVYWDNPDVTPPDRCRFDTCMAVPDGTVLTGIAPEGQVHVQTFGGGPYAVCRFECGPEEIRQAWEDAFAWVCEGGYDCSDAPCHEVYYNNAADHPEGKWIIDIRIPLKPGIRRAPGTGHLLK